MSYEPLGADARARKRAKYHDLIESGILAGYKTKLITVEVGSRGMLGNELKQATNASKSSSSTFAY